MSRLISLLLSTPGLAVALLLSLAWAVPVWRAEGSDPSPEVLEEWARGATRGVIDIIEGYHDLNNSLPFRLGYAYLGYARPDSLELEAFEYRITGPGTYTLRTEVAGRVIEYATGDDLEGPGWDVEVAR